MEKLRFRWEGDTYKISEMIDGLVNANEIKDENKKIKNCELGKFNL